MISNKDLMEFFEKYINDNPIKKEPIYIPDLPQVTKKDYKFGRISRIKRNGCCYFCGFDKVTNKHHIIGRNAGGGDCKKNILVLCPNHHWVLHQSNYILRFWEGYLFMLNKYDSNEITFPHPMQYGYERENPNESMWKRMERLKKKGAIINEG